MRERKVELLVNNSRREYVEGHLVEGGIDYRVIQVNGNRLLYTIILPAHQVESLTDSIQNELSRDEFQLAILPVDVLIPARPEEVKEEGEARPRRRISRDELRAELAQGAKGGPIYLSMVVLSTLVAAIGLYRDNPAVIIGAMVIAPLLGPQMGLALAVTLGDLRLFRSAIQSSVIGLVVAMTVAMLAGLAWPLDPDAQEVVSRTSSPESADIVLALAAGAAGALAFTSGVSASLVGVMVAVALLPPLVVIAELLAQGRPKLAMAAAVGLFANVVGINLAAVATFLLQSVRPRTPFEKRFSARTIRKALTVWLVLLAIYIVLIITAEDLFVR